jgi:hypothetical protein
MSKHVSFKITPVWGGHQLSFVVLLLDGNINQFQRDGSPYTQELILPCKNNTTNDS